MRKTIRKRRNPELIDLSNYLEYSFKHELSEIIRDKFEISRITDEEIFVEITVKRRPFFLNTQEIEKLRKLANFKYVYTIVVPPAFEDEEIRFTLYFTNEILTTAPYAF